MGTKNSCKTAAVMGLLSKGPAEHVLPAPPDRPRDIETITGEILEAKRAGGEAILTIGRGLMEAKAMLPHGEWLPWLEERVEFSEKAAQNFMRIARHYSNPQALADLGATKALMLLAIPDEMRDEFVSTPHMVNGEEKTVIDMTSRELDAAIKERDAALKAAEQAKADQRAADAAREKMAADMAFANQRVEDLQALADRYSAEARELQETSMRLSAELEELRARPVDVAVEADPAAIAAARKEAEAAMQAKLDKARKAQAKAEEARKAAEEAQAQARRELEQARAEAQAVREQAAMAQKKAALTANEDLVLFRTLFDQAQDQVNKLGGVLMKFRAKDPEKAQGLARSLLALAEKIQGVAAQ